MHACLLYLLQIATSRRVPETATDALVLLSQAESNYAHATAVNWHLVSHPLLKQVFADIQSQIRVYARLAAQGPPRSMESFDERCRHQAIIRYSAEHYPLQQRLHDLVRRDAVHTGYNAQRTATVSLDLVV